MIIGLHIQEKNSPLLASIKLLAANSSEHHFILFTSEQQGNIPNSGTVLISPKPKNKLLLFYWYNYKLPALLKKNEVDVFISDAGMLNLKTTTPQYLYFSNINFETDRNSYFKKAFSKALVKAEGIFTTEDFITDTLRDSFSVHAEKIHTVYYGFQKNNETQGISGDALKEKFTDGFEYYIYPVTATSKQHLITTLKAFSQLKKWQKSSIKLVLLHNEISSDGLIPDFKNYKYKDDVKIISASEEHAEKLISYAFAMISLSGYSSHKEILNALLHEVPVITTENSVNRSLFGEAVLYSFISDSSLAERMQLIYKDETLRFYLTQNSKNILEKYDPEKSASALLNAILNDKTVIPLKKATT